MSEKLTITTLFLSILLLFVTSQFVGLIFQRLHLPKVVGEIAGGILLGPTCFGYFFPEQFQFIFQNQVDNLSVFYWFGLVLLMFCSGFEFNRNFSRADFKTILWLTIASTAIPLVFGWFITYFMDISNILGKAENTLALKLVVAIAIGITSIPVISRIFFELKIIDTQFSRIVLSTATFHDVLLWILLTIAISLVSAEKATAWYITSHVLITLFFFVIVLLIIPKLMNIFHAKVMKILPINIELTIIIFIMLLFVTIASFLNINIIFGAFLGGIVVAFNKNLGFERSKKYIREFSFSFFIPIYFAIVGLKIDLIHDFDLWFFSYFFVLAMLIQGLTVVITSKFLNYSWLSSVNLAMAMNARGGPGIVLATVGYDFGIINEKFFVSIIMLSLVSSLFAGIWLKFVLKNNYSLLDKNPV